MPKRTTIKEPATIVGVGLFTAQPTRVTIKPAPEHSGILFQYRGHTIPATIAHLSSCPVHPIFAQLKPRCTSIGDPHCTIATIEHLLSALVGLGISDAIIEIDSNTPEDQPLIEVPIMDGSALPFVEAIQTAGLKTLESPIEPIVINQTIRVDEGENSITIEPASSTRYSYTLNYSAQSNLSALAKTTVNWDGDPDIYTIEVAPSRTFCLKYEADAMHKAGLFTHLSPKEMLVLDETGPIDNSLHSEHECANHKLLDLIGDLGLVGRPIQAKIIAIKSGHALAHEAARKILEQIG